MSEAILSSQSLNSSSEYEDIGIFYNDNSGGYNAAAIAVPIDILANYKELCVHTKFLQNLNVINAGSYSDGYIKIFGVPVEYHAKGATLPQSTEIYPMFANVYIFNDLYSSKKVCKILSVFNSQSYDPPIEAELNAGKYAIIFLL